MTSLPAAPARTTLAEAPHPGDLSGPTVAVRVPVESDVIPQAGARVEAPAAVGRRVMSEGLRAQAPAEVNAGPIVIVIVAGNAVLAAGRIARASVAARC